MTNEIGNPKSPGEIFESLLALNESLTAKNNRLTTALAELMRSPEAMAATSTQILAREIKRAEDALGPRAVHGFVGGIVNLTSELEEQTRKRVKAERKNINLAKRLRRYYDFASGRQALAPGFKKEFEELEEKYKIAIAYAASNTSEALDAAREEIARLKKDNLLLADNTRQRDSVHARIALESEKLREELTALQANFNKGLAVVDELRAENAHLKATTNPHWLDNYKVALGEARIERDALRAELEATKIERDNFQKSFEGIRENYARLRRRLTTSHRKKLFDENEALRVENAKLKESENGNAVMRAKQMMRERDALRAELDAIRAKFPVLPGDVLWSNIGTPPERRRIALSVQQAGFQDSIGNVHEFADEGKTWRRVVVEGGGA